MNKNNKQTLYLSRKFLKKINYADSMSIDEHLKSYNLKLYPTPDYVGMTELIKSNKTLNWRKINSWADQGLVRTKLKKVLKDQKSEYNPQIHLNFEPIEIKFYAKEDFNVLIERDNLVKGGKINLILKEFRTSDGKKVLLRDFSKTNPDLKEIDNLSDSFATFISYLAIKKIQSELSDSEESKKLISILKSVIPKSK